MLTMLETDSQPGILSAIKLIWVHKDQSTRIAEAKHSPGDILYLFTPEGHRVEGIFCGEYVNFGRGRTREVLGPF